MSYCRGSSFEARPLAGLKTKRPPIPAAKAKAKAAPVVPHIPPENFINEDVWNAAFGGDMERLQYLLTDGLNPSLRPDLAALFFADPHESLANASDNASAGKRRAAQLLARRGRPFDGATPLFAAAAGGHCNVLTYLIDRGASPQQPRHDGATPFFVACLMNHLPAAQLLARAVGPQTALTTPTMDACTPLLAAAYRGHLHVDLARSTLSRSDSFEKLLRARSVNGSRAIDTARRRGHEKIAAFLEWNLEVPGVRNHYQSTDKTASSSSSRGTCGLQAKVGNAGKWAHELDAASNEAVNPTDYCFDLYTNKKLPVHHRHEASAGFSNAGPRPKPRNPGGCCTTLNVFEVLSEDPKSSGAFKQHGMQYSRSTSKAANSSISMNNSMASSGGAGANSALKQAKREEQEAHVQMVAGRFTSAAEKFTKAFGIYVSQAGDSFLIPEEESAVLGESYSSYSSSRKNNTATMEAFGDPSADDDIKGSAGPLPSPSSVGAFRRSDDHTPSEGAAGGIDKDPAFNDVSIPSNRLRSSRNGSLLELSPTTLPLPTGKATITKSRSFTADSALRRSKALSSLPSVSVDMGRSAVKVSAYDLEMRAAYAAKATCQATRESAAAGARLCCKMAIHCRRAGGLGEGEKQQQIECSGLEELLVANAHL